MSISIPVSCPTNVAVLDDQGPGGAHHSYSVQFGGPEQVLVVNFQRGPRGVDGSTPGVFGDDLLAIMEHRLACFQAGPFACAENGDALAGVRAARSALGKRAAARQAQGVLGLNETHKSDVK